jgi:hypothetical protein
MKLIEYLKKNRITGYEFDRMCGWCYSCTCKIIRKKHRVGRKRATLIEKITEGSVTMKEAMFDD